MALGPNDMKQFMLPSGWDAGELSRYALADGTTYDEITNLIAAGLVQSNAALMSDPLYGTLMSFTDQLGVEYRSGAASGMQERTEYRAGDPHRAGTTAHMIPLKSFDRVLGWTWDFLRVARSSQIESDVAAALYDVKDNWQRTLLRRYFSNASNTIATSGVDAPFVNGTTTPLDYRPPGFNGANFANTHNHFDRKTDDATGRIAAFNAGVRHLAEHGITGPWYAMIPEVDAPTFSALTGWFKPDTGIRYIRTDAAVNFGVAQMSDNFIGGFESELGPVYAWTTPRLPTDYLGIYKTYGVDDQRNPLLVRGSLDYGPEAILLPGMMQQRYPLEYAILFQEFGVGVSEGRLNGYACHFAASGDYVVPIIT